MTKTFTRQIVTKEALDHITQDQIKTAPVTSPAPVVAEGIGGETKRGRPRRAVELVTFNLRLPADVVEEIDRRRGGLVSRNAWVSMAVGEKLKRDS